MATIDKRVNSIKEHSIDDFVGKKNINYQHLEK
jgi:hypothetical protein